MPKPPRLPKSPKVLAPDEATGTYKFDRKLGRMVKVSDRVPGLRRGSSAAEPGPCGRPRSACGGGACSA